MRYNRFTKATDESVKTKNNNNKKAKIAHRINSFYNVTRTLSQSCHRRQCHEWAKRKPKSYRYSKLKKIRTSPNATTRSLFSGFSFCFLVFFFFFLTQLWEFLISCFKFCIFDNPFISFLITCYWLFKFHVFVISSIPFCSVGRFLVALNCVFINLSSVIWKIVINLVSPQETKLEIQWRIAHYSRLVVD